MLPVRVSKFACVRVDASAQKTKERERSAQTKSWKRSGEVGDLRAVHHVLALDALPEVVQQRFVHVSLASQRGAVARVVVLLIPSSTVSRAGSAQRARREKPVLTRLL
eukprot:3173776-Rhodomonas_salina.1